MVDRLVLGGSSLSHRLVEELADKPGTVRVLVAEEQRADVFEDGVTVTIGDPTDADQLRDIGPVEMVVIAGDDPQANLVIAHTVRNVYPDAYLLAFSGLGANGVTESLRTVADNVVDPTSTVAESLLARVGDTGVQVRQLSSVLRSIDRLAVVAHDNPDPDAIASAVALGRIAEKHDCEVDICYYGNITHQENRAFVNLLEFDLRNLEADDPLDSYDGFALVDHSRPGVNDGLPEDLQVDIVVDHHPPRAPVEARFVDLRSDVGATSTLLVDYLEQFEMDLQEDVATGLLFGIRVDTKEFTREVSPADFTAAATLLPAADLGMLERIESPSISPETFETIASAIQNRRREGPVLLSCVGRMSDRDALAQAADRLLTLEGVSTTLVYGVTDGTIFVSARTQGTGIDLGEILRDAYGRIGSAGGHADMAGAQITVGVMEAVDDLEESLLEIVESVIADRFLEALEDHTETTAAGVYSPDYTTDEYLAPDEELPPDTFDVGVTEGDDEADDEADENGPAA